MKFPAIKRFTFGKVLQVEMFPQLLYRIRSPLTFHSKASSDSIITINFTTFLTDALWNGSGDS
jgi:hypothetical protein